MGHPTSVQETSVLLPECHQEASLHSKELDVYEFGVYSGHSFAELMLLYRRYGLSIRKFLGFDSFQGLPPESEGVARHPEWFIGQYNSVDFYQDRYKHELNTRHTPSFGQNTSISEIRRPWQDEVDKVGSVLSILKDNLDQCEQVYQLIPGFFENSLTPETAVKHDMKPAAYVHVDVDLYVSTVHLLRFLHEQQLLVPGTIIRYDDWYGTAEWQGGESLAHKEAEERYGSNFRRLSGNVFVFRGYS